MSYPNAYLRDFVPVLGQILKEKQIAPEKLHLEIIDEESEEKSIFEPVGVDEVLDQLADELNHLTVYTDRPAHFQAFAEQIYEENGLMPLIFTKKQLKSRSFSGAQGVADRETCGPGWEIHSFWILSGRDSAISTFWLRERITFQSTRNLGK